MFSFPPTHNNNKTTGSPDDRGHERARSRSPAKPSGGAANDSGAAANDSGGDWKEILDRLYEKGEIKRGDIEDRIISDLETMPPADSALAMTRLEGSDIGSIRNINGFVVGIMRRIKDSGGGDGPSLSSLPSSVRAKIDELVSAKKIDADAFDGRLVRALSRLSERSALEALNRYDQSYDDTIRSPQGFMMGILKRFGENERDNGGGGGRYGDRGGGDRYGGGGGGGGRYGGGGGDRYRDRRGGGGGGGYGDRDRGGDRYGGDRGYGGGGGYGGDRGGGDRYGGDRGRY